MSFAKRLVLHQREMEKNPPPLCFAEPKDADKDMTSWTGYIEGPEDTPYAGGRFYLTIKFPLDYPFRPPEIQFVTPIYHPNISTKGEICLDILHSQWSPVLSIRSVLISLCSLLNDANPEHGLNKDALTVYQRDQEKFNRIAMEWTQNYAFNNHDN